MTNEAPKKAPKQRAFEKAGLDGYGPDVRAHFKFVLTSILVGVVLMGATAVWAWNTYGAKLSDAPPLPTDAPPLSAVPQTTR
jgi:hypothetical protein